MSGKNAGKNKWAGQRRPVTRKSGFKSTSQLRIKSTYEQAFEAGLNKPLTLEFNLPPARKGEWRGWGAYIFCPSGTVIDVSSPNQNYSVSDPESGCWTKLGGLWQENSNQPTLKITVEVQPKKNCNIGIYDAFCGLVRNQHLESSRKELLSGMHKYSPEANFYINPEAAILKTKNKASNENALLSRKTCNRCGRFLPINTFNELNHLAFTNHCKARKPCVHSGFGKISEFENELTIIQFEYGFQLECRFCKKFEVNGALNPQRTSGQMKEDAARRRHFELLLEHLYQGSPQLRYKNLYGTDLALDIWEKFDRKCFKCNKMVGLNPSSDLEAYNLDHTRPLALLWPLDETATCLCKSCNTSKRDRSPADFYTHDELVKLSKITGISIHELLNPSPNIPALVLLDSKRNWLYTEFLRRPELSKIRDGKLTADLVIKALNRVIDLCSDPKPISKF